MHEITLATLSDHHSNFRAPYNQRVLERLTKWPVVQHKPNLRGPLLGGECSVEIEAMPTILTQALQGLFIGMGTMGTLWHNSQAITAPSIQSSCARKPLTNCPAFQHEPNLRGPPLGGEW